MGTNSDKSVSTEQERKEMAEKLYLLYFNNYLFEKGVISERDRNRMKVIIENRNSRGTK